MWESRRRGVRYQGNLFDRKNTTFFGFFGRKKRHLFFFWTHSASMFPRTYSFVFFKQAPKRWCFFWKSVPKNPIEQNHQNSSKTVFFMFSKQAVYCDFVNSLYRERVSSIFWRASVGVFLQILWFYWTDKCTSFPKSLVGWTLSIDKS